MLFSGEERFHESSVSCDTDADFMPQTSLLSANGGAKMQEPWYQGPAPSTDRNRTSPLFSSPLRSGYNSELDAIKPRQPSFSFGKATKHHKEQPQSPPTTHPPLPTPSVLERSQSPVKYFGSSPRSQTIPAVSNTPSISVEAADRAYQHVLPVPTTYTFSASTRQQKLAPSSTPGPGQYRPTPRPVDRTPTLKSRTKILGHTKGEDSPGPNSYTLPSTLLKKSHNVRSNGFGSENSAMPNPPGRRTGGQAPQKELAKVPCPPSRVHMKRSTEPGIRRHRNVFQAADMIAWSNDPHAPAVMQEHFSKDHVKGARQLFQKLLSRTASIIENTRPTDPTIAVNCRDDASGGDSLVSNTGATEEGGGDMANTTVKEEYPLPESKENRFAVGDRVLCNYCDNGQWCPGVITLGAEGGLYDVLYDDGDQEEGREEAAVMALPSESGCSSSYRVGDLIFGNYDAKGIWFEGVVTMCVQEEGGDEVLFDVEYSDGDVEYGVPSSCLMAQQPILDTVM